MPAGPPSPSGRAARVAGWYALAGLLWIAFSDRLVEQLVPLDHITTVQTYKGWTFVAATALLVFVATLRALRAQQQTVRTLDRQQSRFRTYLDHAPMAVFVIDNAGRCVEANQQAADLLGCDVPTLLTLGVADIVPSDADGSIGAAAMATLATQHWVEGDFRVRRRTGEIIWMHTRAAGLDQGHFIACAYDVTARVAAEHRLRQAAVVFDSTREGIIVTDRESRILTVNRAFTEITGYEESEIVGRTPSVLKSDVQDRDWYRRMWRDVNEAGHWQGEIWNRRKTGELYPEWLTVSAVRDSSGGIANYVGVFTDITRIKHSEAELDYLAHSDALTGLANRLLLDSRLDHALARASRTGRSVAVAAVDIDGFKKINDALGLEAGDEVLRAVAVRLRAKLEDGDTIARIGADEFITVREDLPGPQAAGFAEALLDVFASPVALESGAELHLTASIGISIFPDDATTPSELTKQAVSAVAPVKAAGGKSYGFHTPAMEREAKRRLTLEGDLRRALRQREFLLHYQPRFVLGTGELEGVEALLRWRLPDGTLRYPDEFIETAESIGVIEPIGTWVIGEACRQFREWAAGGGTVRTMAVNVSPRQLRDSGFLSHVVSALTVNGMPASALELEITESLTLDPGRHIDALLAEISGLGVRIAIDDFGVGYSSLSRLARMPVNTLKIDRSFVSAITEASTGRELVTTIAAMAGNLGLETVAEGVETEAQASFLRQSGCALAQGYLFCRPVPPSEITPMIGGRR